MDTQDLLAQVCPPLDRVLTESLLSEFVDMERRFILGDWEPAMLDGGQFVELASRIIYHIDSGNLNRRKGVDSCLRYVEDPTNNNTHSFSQRRAALHLSKVLRTMYKFRSQRGAIHIDPDYSANELDATMLMGNTRWVVSELLRLFWSGSTHDIVTTIQEILHFDVPAVLRFDNRRLVLRTDCTVEEEILLLLHDAGGSGLTRAEIGSGVPRSAPSISNSLSRLASARHRCIVRRSDNTFALTPNGVKRIREQLADKMVLS